MMSANLNLNMKEDEEEYQEELEQALETQEILAVPVPNRSMNKFLLLQITTAG